MCKFEKKTSCIFILKMKRKNGNNDEIEAVKKHKKGESESTIVKVKDAGEVERDKNTNNDKPVNEGIAPICFAYQKGTCKKATCKFSHEEVCGVLPEVHKKKEEDDKSVKSGPESICFAYQKGTCKKSTCKFSHVIESNAKVETVARKEKGVTKVKQGAYVVGVVKIDEKKVEVKKNSNDSTTLSKKQQKKLRDQGFNEKFKAPVDEIFWRADLKVENDTFWKSTLIDIKKQTTRDTSFDINNLVKKAYIECCRASAYNGLRKYLAKLCERTYPSLAFERWLLISFIFNVLFSNYSKLILSNNIGVYLQRKLKELQV